MPPKRICLFLLCVFIELVESFQDGTFNNAIRARNRSGITNIWRMSRAVDIDNAEEQTMVIYEEGVGSDVPGIIAFLEGATGLGLSQKIVSAYNVVASNWVPGDKICIWGFSRGAYTARTIAALLCDIGILAKSDMEFFPEIFHHYQKLSSKNDKVVKAANDYLDPWRRKCRPTREAQEFIIEFLGVFDTVGSQGIPGMFARPGKLNLLGFPDLYLSPRVKHARHAMALNENRTDFIATRWLRNPRADQPPAQTLKQVWFAGSHSDVGGGWPEADLSYIALFWMVEQAMQCTNIKFDINYLLSIMKTVAPYAKQEIHDPISQGGTMNLLASDILRRFRGGNEEHIHGSVVYADTIQWAAPKTKALLVDAPFTVLEGVEQLLYEKWDSLPKGQIKTKPLNAKSVRFRARFHDIIYWLGPRNVAPPAKWSRKHHLDSNDEEKKVKQKIRQQIKKEPIKESTPSEKSMEKDVV